MKQNDTGAADLLAMVGFRLEVISETQHRLSREREIYRLAATRLRTGVDPDVVRAQLQAAGVSVPGIPHQAPR